MNSFMNDVHARVSKQIADEAAARNQLTLGEMVILLENADQTKPVRFTNGRSPGYYDSYRGYYEFVAVDPCDDPITVAEFLELTKVAIGATYAGYKGGNFTMSKNTPVWISHYGEASGWCVSAITELDTYVEIGGIREDDYSYLSMSC